MFGSIGFPEILFILVIALLIFGPKRLPEVGRTIGKGLREFRKASNELRHSVEQEILLEDKPAADRPVPAAVPAAAPDSAPAGTAARREGSPAGASAKAEDGAEPADNDAAPISTS